MNMCWILPSLLSLQIHPKKTHMKTSSWIASAPSSLCPPLLEPIVPRFLQRKPSITLYVYVWSIWKIDSTLSTDFKARLLQAEFSQELQAAGPAENQPVDPQHQQRRCFISTPAQPPLHSNRARTHFLAARGSLQPYLPQDTDGVCLSAYFRAEEINHSVLFLHTESKLCSNRLYWESTASLRLGSGRNIYGGSIITLRQAQGEVMTVTWWLSREN